MEMYVTGDGIWRATLESSLWWNWPEFEEYTHKDVIVDGKVLMNNGSPVRQRRDDEEVKDVNLENAFLMKWWEVVNTRPCLRFPSRLIVTPASYERYQRGQDLTWNQLRAEGRMISGLVPHGLTENELSR